MTELIVSEKEGEKCAGCGYRVTNLYRFEDEEEELDCCADCLVRAILEDGFTIATPDELVVGNEIPDQIDDCLGDLQEGNLDELETNLRSVTDTIEPRASA